MTVVLDIFGYADFRKYTLINDYNYTVIVQCLAFVVFKKNIFFVSCAL